MRRITKSVQCSLLLEIHLLGLSVLRSSSLYIFLISLCFPFLSSSSYIHINNGIMIYLRMLFYLQEYQSFRIGSDGNLQGVGLFINSEPRTGHLVSRTKEIFSFLILFIAVKVIYWLIFGN